MVKMSTVWAAAVGLLMFVAAAPAAINEVTLQEGLNGYVGTQDTDFSQGPDSSYNQPGGGHPSMYTFGSSFDRDVILVGFDLSSLGTVTSVQEAKLGMYMYAQAYGGSQFKVQQLNATWVEGTGTNTWSDKLDGAGHRNRYPPLELMDSDWVATGGLSWKYTVANAPLGPRQKDESDTTKRWVIRSADYPDYCHAGRITVYEQDGGKNDGTGFSSLKDLEDYDEGTAGAFSNGFGYFYDSSTDEVYMRTTGDAGKPTRIYVVDDDNWWSAATRYTAGDFEAQTNLGTGGAQWVEFDVTELLKRWFGTDGFSQQPNGGVQLDCVNSSGAGGRFFSREVVTYDFTAGSFAPDSPDAEDVTDLRPKLYVKYVPEPATMSLIGLGFSGMLLFRRRRK